MPDKKPAIVFQTWWGFLCFITVSTLLSDIFQHLMGWR
jgi:hypothetical protein